MLSALLFLFGFRWVSPKYLNGTTDAWGDEFFCDGSSISDVSNSAADLVPTNAVVACGGCSQNNFTQIWYDNITNLYITNELSGDADWDDAVIACDGLTSGTGPGADAWRVPTAKELHMLAIIGFAAHKASFDGSLDDYHYWAATTSGTVGDEDRAMTVGLSDGWSQAQDKTSTFVYQILCVRDGPG